LKNTKNIKIKFLTNSSNKLCNVIGSFLGFYSDWRSCSTNYFIRHALQTNTHSLWFLYCIRYMVEKSTLQTSQCFIRCFIRYLSYQ